MGVVYRGYCNNYRNTLGGHTLDILKNGEIRKLPKANSPMWSEQWAYQGTAKMPYIVSAKKKAGNGVTSGWDQTWGCSCGKELPCKHVIAVQLKEKLAVSNVTFAFPTTTKTKIIVVGNTPPGVVGLNSGKKPSRLEERGRKFRTE